MLDKNKGMIKEIDISGLTKEMLSKIRDLISDKKYIDLRNQKGQSPADATNTRVLAPEGYYDERVKYHDVYNTIE